MQPILNRSAKAIAFERLKNFHGLKTAKDLMLEKASIASSKSLPAQPQKRTAHTPKFPQSTIPLYQARVAAGTPTATEDILERSINLHEHLISNSQQTFCVRVQGDSMTDAGIQDNDLLVVNTWQKPRNGHIIVAAIDNELTVKRLQLCEKGVSLVPENPHLTPLTLTEFMSFTILGVVQHVIHSF